MSTDPSSSTITPSASSPSSSSSTSISSSTVSVPPDDPTVSSTVTPTPTPTTDTSTSPAPTSSITPTPPPTSPTEPTSSPTPTPPSSTSTETTSSSSSFTPIIVPTSSTSIVESTSVGTSNGLTFTTIIQVTSIVPTIATASAAAGSGGGNSTNTAAIVGGVVGGIVGLSALVLLVWFLLRKRRRQDRDDDFDGNFDPARVVSTNNNRLNIAEDDNTSPPTIAPFTLLNTGDGAAAPEMKQFHGQPPFENFTHAGAGPYYPFTNASSSPPPTAATTTSPSTYYGGYGPGPGPNHSGPWQGNAPFPVSAGSDGGYTTASSGLPYAAPGGMAGPGVTAAILGRGPSPGPSVPPSEGGSGSASGSGHGHGSGGGAPYGPYPPIASSGYGRSAKEREAFGGVGGGRLVVSNAEEGGTTGLDGGGSGGAPAFPQPQLQEYPNVAPYGGSSGPRYGSPPPQGLLAAPGVLHPHGGVRQPAVSSTSRNEKVETGRPGSSTAGVIVHQDGGRIPQEDDDSEGANQEEIPPTYDSIPVEDRR